MYTHSHSHPPPLPHAFHPYESSSLSSYTRTLPLPPHSRGRVRPNIPPPLMRSSQWSYAGGLDAHAYPSPPMTTSPTSPKRQQFLDERQHQLHLQLQQQQASHHQQQQQHHHQSQQQHRYQYSQGPSHEHIQSPTSAPSQDPSRSAYMASQILPAPSGPPSYPYGPHHAHSYLDQHPHLQPRPRAQSIPPYQQTYAATAYAQPSMMGMQGPPSHMSHVYHGPVTVSPVVGRIPRSGSRRAKAHVARACQNCKKAHLSCDEQRPCSRCVATRREATCIDVAHKKRGRPRIQPEREAVGAQRGPPAIVPPSHLPAASDSPYRMLRSQHSSAADRRGSLPVIASSSHSYSPPSQQSQSHSQSYYDPRMGPVPQSASADITSFRQAGQSESRRWRTDSHPLVLFLNLDFRILKLMEPLLILLEGRGDLRGTLLQDVLDIRHHETLRRLQTDLRNERTNREPDKLPSIFSAREQEAVQHLTESDVPRITQGFSVDFNDTWTFVLSQTRAETFHCRVRLARNEIVFVVVELQRIASAATQGVQHSAGPASDLFERRSPFNAPLQLSKETHTPAAAAPVSPFARSEPVSPFASLTSHAMSLPHGIQSTMSNTLPTASPAHEHGYSSSSYFPRQLTTSSPGTTSYTSTTATGMQPPPYPSSSGLPPLQRTSSGREMPPPEPLSSVQLPPIVGTSAPTTPIASSFQEARALSAEHRPSQHTPGLTTPQQQQGSSSTYRGSPADETDEESSRKRRRLDIGEIIDK